MKNTAAQVHRVNLQQCGNSHSYEWTNRTTTIAKHANDVESEQTINRRKQNWRWNQRSKLAHDCLHLHTFFYISYIGTYVRVRAKFELVQRYSVKASLVFYLCYDQSWFGYWLLCTHISRNLVHIRHLNINQTVCVVRVKSKLGDLIAEWKKILQASVD